MRGKIAKENTQDVHLLGAYRPEVGVTVAQKAGTNKENEMVAAPRLLAKVDVRRKTVSGDAMLAWRELSVAVKAHGGECL